MTEEREKTYCYRHPNKETRITCTECGKYICTSCIIQAPVGQKCPDCVNSHVTHLEKISPQQYFIAGIVGIIVSSILSYIWFKFAIRMFLIDLLLAYVVGYATTKAIGKAIGSKIGFRIQALAGATVLLGMLYNPINIFLDYMWTGYNVDTLVEGLKEPINNIVLIVDGGYGEIWWLIAIVIAVWACVRHFRF